MKRFSDFWKTWLMLAQLEERQGNIEGARRVYARAVIPCGKSVPVWRSYAALEARQGSFAKARAILDTARLRVPKDPGLWLATVRCVWRVWNQCVPQRDLVPGSSSECACGTR